MVPLLLHKKDFYAGVVMILLGAGVALNSTTYSLGTLTHMGPGMFPFMLGIVLAFVGILIFGTAVLTPHDPDERILPKNREWRGWFCILAGPLMFMVFGEYLGMVPAIFACVFVSALGDRTATLKSSFLLAAGMAISGTILFSYILKIPFPIFRVDF